MLNFDLMLDELGELGRFQLITYFLICLPILFSGANSLSYVFTAGIPNYRCYIPSCDNLTDLSYHETWLSIAIPNENQNSAEFKPTQCTKYKELDKDRCVKENFGKEIVDCNEWVFDVERTIVNDWNITCLENQIKLSFIGNMHFIGIMVGSIMFGILSDKYGRKNMFIISTIIMALAGVAHVVSLNYTMFLVITLFHAIGTSGVYPLGFILGVEMVGIKKREFAAIVLNFFYAIGESLLGVVAWQVQDWTITQLIVSAPCILFAMYICFLPESVRWLLVKNRNIEAKEVVLEAARINKITLSNDVIESFQTSTLDDEENKKVDLWPTLLQVLRSRKLLSRYIILCLIWLANAFIYYGLSLNSTSMVGSKYLNFILVCLIEIPGYLLSWILILKVGRKYTLIGTMLLCAANCGAAIFIKEDLSWLIIVLFLLGKLTITASFGLIYVYTAELLPTTIRSAGIATTSTCARIGAFLAPFVPLLGIYYRYMPMLLFTVIAALAGALAFKLPETLNKKLPETVDDAKLI